MIGRSPDLAPRPARERTGDQRRRLIRHHLPLAAASAVLLIAFIALPQFDPRLYPRAAMTQGLLPQAAEADPAEAHSAEQTAAPGHGGRTSPMPGHGVEPSPSPGHAVATTSPAHGAGASPQPENTTPPAAPHEGPSSAAIQDRTSIARLTLATGYVATALLGITLVIGPSNLLLRRRNPVSSYLRRDVGMWTAAFSVIHVFFGLQVHSGGQLSGFLAYFFSPDGTALGNSFGLGNWTGLAATAIVLALLAISSDLALRGLRAGPWKWIQRLNYALFGLVLAHAFFYGALVRTMSPFTQLLLLTALAVLVAQLVGVWLWRQRHTSHGRLA